MSRRGGGKTRADDPRYRDATWHRAGQGGDGPVDGAAPDSAGRAGAIPGGLARSHEPVADSSRRAERAVVHGAVAASLIVLLVLMITVVWPAVSFLWSKARPVVDTLSTDAVYVGPGVSGVDAEHIAGIIGTRPIAEIVLAKGDPLAADALGTCVAVTDQLPGLIVQVVVDGEFENGCEGDDIAYASGVEWEGWDFRFWLEQSYATSLADGDVPELTRQFALAYEAEVTGGRVLATEREFHPQPQRTLIALGIAAAVVAGTAGLFVALRLAARWGFSRADRRHAWEHRRDEIDGELGDIALIMVTVRPDEPSNHRLASAVGAVAGDYRAALQQLAEAGPGEDLGALSDTVRDIRNRLTAAGARG